MHKFWNSYKASLSRYRLCFNSQIYFTADPNLFAILLCYFIMTFSQINSERISASSPCWMRNVFLHCVLYPVSLFAYLNSWSTSELLWISIHFNSSKIYSIFLLKILSSSKLKYGKNLNLSKFARISNIVKKWLKRNHYGNIFFFYKI